MNVKREYAKAQLPTDLVQKIVSEQQFAEKELSEEMYCMRRNFFSALCQCFMLFKCLCEAAKRPEILGDDDVKDIEAVQRELASIEAMSVMLLGVQPGTVKHMIQFLADTEELGSFSTEEFTECGSTQLMIDSPEGVIPVTRYAAVVAYLSEKGCDCPKCQAKRADLSTDVERF